MASGPCSLGERAGIRETAQALRRARSTAKPAPPMMSTAATEPMITQVSVPPEPESCAAAEVGPLEERELFGGWLEGVEAEGVAAGVSSAATFWVARGSAPAGPGLNFGSSSTLRGRSRP